MYPNMQTKTKQNEILSLNFNIFKRVRDKIVNLVSHLPNIQQVTNYSAINKVTKIDK